MLSKSKKSWSVSVAFQTCQRRGAACAELRRDRASGEECPRKAWGVCVLGVSHPELLLARPARVLNQQLLKGKVQRGLWEGLGQKPSATPFGNLWHVDLIEEAQGQPHARLVARQDRAHEDLACRGRIAEGRRPASWSSASLLALYSRSRCCVFTVKWPEDDQSESNARMLVRAALVQLRLADF